MHGTYGTHNPRKTRDYHAHMQAMGLAIIMHKLNHESIVYAKRFLGTTDDELEVVAKRLNF